MCKPLRGWLAGKEVSGPEGPCIRQPGPFYGPAALAGAGHGPAALDELCTVVEDEGTTLNQVVSVAVAEKLAALRTERCFQARAARADRADFLTILEKAGSEIEIAGDKLPPA